MCSVESFLEWGEPSPFDSNQGEAGIRWTYNDVKLKALKSFFNLILLIFVVKNIISHKITI